MRGNRSVSHARYSRIARFGVAGAFVGLAPLIDRFVGHLWLRPRTHVRPPAMRHCRRRESAPADRQAPPLRPRRAAPARHPRTSAPAFRSPESFSKRACEPRPDREPGARNVPRQIIPAQRQIDDRRLVARTEARSSAAQSMAASRRRLGFQHRRFGPAGFAFRPRPARKRRQSPSAAARTPSSPRGLRHRRPARCARRACRHIDRSPAPVGRRAPRSRRRRGRLRIRRGSRTSKT